MSKFALTCLLLTAACVWCIRRNTGAGRASCRLQGGHRSLWDAVPYSPDDRAQNKVRSGTALIQPPLWKMDCITVKAL